MKLVRFLTLAVLLASILVACGGGDAGTSGTGGAASTAPGAGASTAASAGTGTEASTAASTRAGTEASAAASTGAGTAASPAASGAASTAAGGTGTTAAADCTPKGPKADRLLWWVSQLEDAPEHIALRAIADQYTAATGTPIEIVGVVEQFKEKITIAGPAGEGPDVIGPVAHDWLGEFQLTNVASVIPELQNQDDFLPQVVQAVTVNNQLYGVPLWLETVALIYNKDMVQNPPKTWDEFASTANELTKDGKYGFAFPLLEQYHEGGILHGMGGYIFKQANGTYDVSDIGLNNEGAVAAFKLLRDMYHQQQPQMPEVVIDRANMHAVTSGMMDAGEVAMTIDGPWRESSLTTAGINYGVAPIPTLPNGEPASPFVGVQALAVGEQSENKEAALDLVNFVTCTNSVASMQAGFNRPPARLSAAQAPEVAAKPNVSVWLQQAETGVPMPNHPAMSQVWKPWGDAVDAIIAGNAPDDQIQPLLDNAVQQVKDAIQKTQ